MIGIKVEEAIVGVKVICYEFVTESGVGFGDIITEIISKPWQMVKGTWMVRVKDKKGPVKLTLLEKIKEQ
jgi:ribosome-associated toxin RatA of RatAB toxin-antitoxin module